MRDFLNRFRPKLVRRFAKSDSGATAVEFSLVAFPFFMLMGCICETGIMLFTEYSIQAGVQEAAREIRTGQAQTAGLSAAGFKSKICEITGIVIDCESDLTVYVRPANTFTSLASVLPTYMNVGAKPDGTPNPTSYDCGGPSQAAGVIATYDWDFTMPFMTFLGNINGGEKRRLYGLAIFQNEPFSSTGTCS
ncbi:MAG TPA: TadE/TadG family type IV pilus assembly protein [Aestuariivirga sp.]|nr:TadE/TadG family type IV pilus assembly protein [Aestuariivirga sp.]